jgi:hypothetical protein
MANPTGAKEHINSFWTRRRIARDAVDIENDINLRDLSNSLKMWFHASTPLGLLLTKSAAFPMASTVISLTFSGNCFRMRTTANMLQRPASTSS